jgi:hypothetical protein
MVDLVVLLSSLGTHRRLYCVVTWHTALCRFTRRLALRRRPAAAYRHGWLMVDLFIFSEALLLSVETHRRQYCAVTWHASLWRFTRRSKLTKHILERILLKVEDAIPLLIHWCDTGMSYMVLLMWSLGLVNRSSSLGSYCTDGRCAVASPPPGVCGMHGFFLGVWSCVCRCSAVDAYLRADLFRCCRCMYPGEKDEIWSS